MCQGRRGSGRWQLAQNRPRPAATILAGQPAAVSYTHLDVYKRQGKSYQGNKSFDERLATHSIGKTSTEPNIIYLDLGAGQSKIIDESSQGIGMYTSKPANEVSLGMLVGISFSDQKDTTKIGVIRSIKPVIGNELHLSLIHI